MAGTTWQQEWQEQQRQKDKDNNRRSGGVWHARALYSSYAMVTHPDNSPTTDRQGEICVFATDRGGGATPVVCCRLQVLLRVLLGVVVLLAGQLWICLYLFMLMRKKTKIKEKEPQLIKHLHAHKSFTCISYLVDFLSCRYTHRLCLFSLPCSKQNFLLLLFVSKKKKKKLCQLWRS